MKKILLIFCLIIFFLPFHAQVNRNGLPVITNYKPEEMKTAETNYTLVEDQRGVIYIGNIDDGVVEYDGKNWHKIPIPNKSAVHSLAIDHRGTIYAGAVGEFGFLEPDVNGQMVYRSLSSLVDSANGPVSGNFMKTHCHGDTVYFCSPASICRYDHQGIKVLPLPAGSNFTFLVDDRLYVGNFIHGLMRVTGDTVVTAPGGGFFRLKNVWFILPWKDSKWLIGTREQGLFSYKPENGEVEQAVVEKWVNDLLMTRVLYGGIKIPGGGFAINTLFAGGFILDEELNVLNHINKENGLQDETIAYAYTAGGDQRPAPLWFALSSGLSRADYHIPLRKIDEMQGLYGFVMDVIRFRGDLFVATFNGIYKLQDDAVPVPILYEGEPVEQVWKFTVTKDPRTGRDMLLAGSQVGVYDVTDGKKARWFDAMVRGREDPKRRFNVFTMHVDPARPDLILLGGNSGINLLRYHGNAWHSYKLRGIKDEIRSLCFDPDGSIWAGSWLNGVFHVSFTDTDTLVKHYDLSKGLPLMKENEILRYNDGWRVGTHEGIYVLDREKDLFVPDTGFPEVLHNGYYSVYRMKRDERGMWWIFAYRQTEEGKSYRLMTMNRDSIAGSYVLDSITYSRYNRWIDAIYPDRDSLVWFGRSDGLYSFNMKIENRFPGHLKYRNQPYYTLIRRVRANQDSVLFAGTFFETGEDGRRMVAGRQAAEFKYVFPFSMRNLDIEWVAPFFEEPEKTLYSYRLLGSQQKRWTDWSSLTEFPFYNLSAGHYTLEVKARNIYGLESETGRFEFTIQPPWYQTIVAYLIYMIIAILIVTLIVRLNARRLVREKIRLEGIVAERTAEVVRQKEEITDSIHYASRIQQALLPAEKTLSDNFPENFVFFRPRDIVSGDFYWMTQKEEKVVVVAADCTGHGVPGAFMSMLGISFLNEIVNIFDILEPDQILNQLRQLVISSLKQTGKANETKDGMDVAVLVFHTGKRTVQYAGAYNPLYIVRPLTPAEKKKAGKGERITTDSGDEYNKEYLLTQVKADKMPIGISLKDEDPFTRHTIKYEPGQAFYIFSDGFVDQFGGEEGKKFLSRNFKELLLSMQKSDMKTQFRTIEQTFIKWKGKYDQVDDIIVIGIRV